MPSKSLKTPLDAEIDRGFSLQRWRELEGTAKKGFYETMGFTFTERDPSILRVDYSILDDLRPDDSIYIHPRYGIAQVRAAAFSRAEKNGWALITRKDYENDIPGIRIFRVA